MTRAAVVAALLALTLAPAAGSSTGGDIGPVLQRFLTRSDEPLKQYRAVRHLDARNGRFAKEASLDVVTELTPDGRFTYRELQATGSDYVLNKVLRPMLAIEERTVGGGDPSKFAVTDANYDVRPGEMVEPGLVKLLVKPRRRDANLIDGAVFIRSADADLVRVEGRLVKNPSFWTSRVDVVRRYERISGVRVPVRLDTMANVKFAGVSTMTMTYDYEMVNGATVPE